MPVVITKYICGTIIVVVVVEPEFESIFGKKNNSKSIRLSTNVNKKKIYKR